MKKKAVPTTAWNSKETRSAPEVPVGGNLFEAGLLQTKVSHSAAQKGASSWNGKFIFIYLSS